MQRRASFLRAGRGGGGKVAEVQDQRRTYTGAKPDRRNIIYCRSEAVAILADSLERGPPQVRNFYNLGNQLDRAQPAQRSLRAR